MSDHQGKAVLHRSDDAHSGWGSLSERPGEIASIEVPLTTLDSFLETQRIEQVDLLKVDVEGSEIELLRGARRSLERHVFRHLFIEFNGVLLAERGLGPAEFLAPLEAAGYKLWPAHVGLVERMRSGADPAHTVWANLLFSAP